MLEALAQRHPGPIQDDPKVVRRDRQFLTDFVGLELHHFPHHERTGRVGRQLLEAKLHHAHELLPRERILGVSPLRRRRFPGPIVLEQRIEFVEVGLLVEHRHEHRLALPLTDCIDDLVLQDPGEPRSHARALRKALARAERRDDRLLHDVLRQVRVPQLQVGHSQQIAAMPVELDGEKCGVQNPCLVR